MIARNWNNFRTKFEGKERDSFEWFCYNLFCRQFNKGFGVFRYKNQSAIEHNPIEVNGEQIAWQAKFYDAPLSSHKKDLKDTLEKCNKYYPNLRKLYIYSNKEWGQNNKGEDPSVKVEIENQAENYNIEIIWYLDSYFQSPFVTVENEDCKKRKHLNTDSENT